MRFPITTILSAAVTAVLVAGCSGTSPDEEHTLDETAFRADYSAVLAVYDYTVDDWGIVAKTFTEVCDPEQTSDMSFKMFVSMDPIGEGQFRPQLHEVWIGHFCPGRMDLLREVEAL
jgi:hypothetical protein